MFIYLILSAYALNDMQFRQYKPADATKQSYGSCYRLSYTYYTQFECKE